MKQRNDDYPSGDPHRERDPVQHGSYRQSQFTQDQSPGQYEGVPAQSGRRYPPGPKGYQRSDERMCEDICERLMQSHHIDSSDVTVQVSGGQVVLEGTVPDRYMKHEIEDLADAAPGVQDVDNRIRVKRGENPPQATS